MTTAAHQEDTRTTQLLQVAAIWHIVYSVGALVGLGFFWQIEVAQGWIRWVGTVLLLAGAAASVAAAVFIPRRDFRGRGISLAVNYLSFLVCFLCALQVLGIFLAIDALADTISRGLWILVGVFAGYLIGAFADRYENYPQRQHMLRRISQAVMAVFGVIFLVAVGILSGLLALLTNLVSSSVAIGLVVGALAFGAAIWIMWREPTGRAFNTTAARAEVIDGYLFLSPNLLGFVLFFAGPLLLSLYISFTDSDAVSKQNWVGLNNYAKIINLTITELQTPDQLATEVIDMTKYDELTRFSIFGKHILIGAEDKLFWISLQVTLVYCILAVPLSVIPALLLANILNSKVPGMQFFRAVYFLPSVAATVGVAIIWQWLYNSSIGYINYGITVIINFINQVLGAGIIDPKLRWTSDSSTALISIVIMAAWQTMGFNTVLFLAGLQNIPGELYEAATVDGAGRLAKFWSVTLPLLAPTTFYVITTTTIQAMQVFEQIFILINPPQGPSNSTLSLVLNLYSQGFQSFRQGYASAIAWVLFILIFIVTLIQFRGQREQT